MYRCAFCGKEVRPKGKGVARQVTGWIPNRKGGGAHHIMYQEPSGKLAHVACLEARENPLEAGTVSLF